MFRSKRPRVGLVLGSGAARGLAHIGVIKALEKHNIPIDYIAGSSIGALVGGLYAATKDIKYIEDLALDTNWRELVKLLDPTFGTGFIAGDKIKDFIQRSLKVRTFEELLIPFAAVATDLREGKAVVFKEGDLAMAIRASISIPFVFLPVKKDNAVLCDGGLTIPIPVSVAKKMGAEYTIAIDLDSHFFTQGREDVGTNLPDTANDVVMLIASHLAKENLKEADFVLAPPVGDVKWRAFFTRERTAEIIARGERAMEEAIPKLFPKRKKKTFWQKFKDVLFMEI